uniref:Uncharacterized protein LOC111130111 isoform X4 n=1 Tax=Crassostrea virginica TaxID=6565 RepID=A0A8B8DY50_CRAVI|nr:uncharacterized protein LOC111130111 isoform X4 [Crassostrea virginica]
MMDANRFFESWLEHKGKQGRGYSKIWCVLKGRTIHIFAEKDNRNENTVIGSLTIDNKTDLECSGNDKEGYKLELTTVGLDKARRVNRFKTRKKVEREMWRAYIVGLSKGTVPNNLDLMEAQIEDIRVRINSFLQEEALIVSGGGTPSIGGGSRHQGLQKRTSVSRSEDSGVDTASRYPQSIGTRHSSSSGSRDTISGGGGGPTMRHKFSNNPRMDDEPPSWFFQNCSRDFAEKILVNSGQFGNTLMRESSSQKSNGSYVISKIGKVDGVVKVEHFEVERIDRGYRIKVENDHEPQKNLTGVINTFRFIAGYDNTIPMRTNNLAELGLTEEDSNPYNMKRIQRELPNKSHELPEPLPGPPSPMEEFDPPAPHRESLYINSPESSTAASSQKSRIPTPPESCPPPPEPHTPGTQAYCNEAEFKDLKGKEPFHKRSKSVPNIWNQMSLHSQGEDDLHTPVNRNIPPPKSVIPAAPPPPPVVNPPACITSPTQKAPVSILKPTNRGALPSLPPLPPTPDEGPRSTVDTSALNAACLGLRPVAKSQEDKKKASSYLPPDHVPTPSQLGLRRVENTKTKEEQTPKDYDDHESFQDKLKRFQKIPPSTAPKPAGKPVTKAKDISPSSVNINKTSENLAIESHDTNSNRRFVAIQNKGLTSSQSSPALHKEYYNSNEQIPTSGGDEDTYDDAISMGVGRKPSFIRKLEEQIGRPAPGPLGAAMVPEIKPMTEEEEEEYHEIK